MAQRPDLKRIRDGRHSYQEGDALIAYVEALEAALAEYADPEWWDYIDEHDAAGWMFMRDRDEPWHAARAALDGER